LAVSNGFPTHNFISTPDIKVKFYFGCWKTISSLIETNLNISMKI
jgi:hypothetical protein